MNKVVVTDGNNIMVGSLVLNNRKELEEYRDYLMGQFKQKSRMACTTRDLFASLVYRDDDSLVKKEFRDSFKIDGIDFVEYKETKYYSDFINSIIFFTSLLGDFNKDNYDKVMTRLFIEEGIFKYEPIDKVWGDFVSNILISKKTYEMYDMLSPDYIAFKSALDEGVISFDVEKNLSKKDSQQTGIFKGIKKDQLNEIIMSSELLLGLDECNKKSIKR